MQLWGNRGTKWLRCATRQGIWPAERTFATSPLLQRSRKSGKKANKSDKPKEEASGGASQPPGVRARRALASTQSFPSIVESVLHDVKRRLAPGDPVLASWARHERYILTASKVDVRGDKSSWNNLAQVKSVLQKAYLKAGVGGLEEEVQRLLDAEAITAEYSTPLLNQQKKVADLRYPAEWFPQARSIQRTIHLHVGPTNSGKTYHALKRLEASKKGFYAGPLRLLAQEVFHRFKEKGVPCGLVTGDDVQVPENGTPTIVSNTVEMVNLGDEYEVGVIDEIQMIADSSRGWAWTRAVLGARATELHLCGEPRVVPLIRELAARTGDTLEIHRYERLNPLQVMKQSMHGDLHALKKGDCIVSFSRIGIHAMKAEIEKVTGRRAAIVYGSLPAEIRTQQARLFNDPDNDYDFLVASDAIGMGLNLYVSCGDWHRVQRSVFTLLTAYRAIKRVIFETVVKRLPQGLVRLTVPEIKQIAGRAGRYRPASGITTGDDEEANVGLVTSMEPIDLPYIQQAMKLESPPLKAAGIFPSNTVIQRFAAYFPPDIPYSYLIRRLLDLCQIEGPFFLCDPRAQLENAEAIDLVPGLRTQDQMTFMAAPTSIKDPGALETVCAFMECVSQHSDGRLLDISQVKLDVLEEPVSGSKSYLEKLEALHKSLLLYLWLGYRFGGVFTDRALASHVKGLVEEQMIRALTEFSANKKLRKDASLRRQIALQKQDEDQRRLLAEAGDLAPAVDENESPVDLSSQEGMESGESSAAEGTSTVDIAPDENSVPDPPATAQTA